MVQADIHSDDDPSGVYTLYDPASLHPSSCLEEKALDQECIAGNLILIETDENYLHLRVIIEENPDPDVVSRSKKVVDNALLRVPTGTLLLTGKTSLMHRKGLPAGKSSVQGIESGNYQIKAYEVNNEVPTDYFRNAMGTSEFNRWKFGCDLQAAGIFLIGAALSLTALAEITGLLWIRWIGLALGIIGFTIWAFRWSPALRHARTAHASADKAWDQKYPTTMVVLKRLPADADLSNLKGAKFFAPS